MPTIELLRKYHLMQFAEVTKAVRYAVLFHLGLSDAESLIQSLTRAV